MLACPVVISVDCTKMTRTAAALVRGMLYFETGIRFAGVVLNQVGSSRHERILRQALEKHDGCSRAWILTAACGRSAGYNGVWALQPEVSRRYAPVAKRAA